ncbi:MAG: hypothetical protein WBC44_20000 [Planctomycetaceae bacterium]
MRAALEVDAGDYYWSACISVVDGLRAVDAEFFTWSTVKMYYAVFYALRALLAWDGVTVFHVGTTPYWAKATAGAFPVWVPGIGTHQAVLACFRTLNPNSDFVTQPIEFADDGLAWMLEKREDANYNVSRFSEPAIPGYYASIAKLGVRKAVGAYLDPKSGVTPFDKDHAVVAFPIAVLAAAAAAANARGGAIVSEDELAFLKRKCRERDAALSPVSRLIAGSFKTA